MKISKTHEEFAEHLNNPRVIYKPEKFLGPNWKDVLNFWLFLDTLSENQWGVVTERSIAIDVVAQAATREATRFTRDLEFYYTGFNPSFGGTKCAAVFATRELTVLHNLLSQNNSLTFFPMFLNL